MINYRSLYFFLWVFAIGLPFMCVSQEKEEKPPRITLSAQATIQKPPNELRLSIGVVNINATAQEALSENSSKMQAVIASLTSAGLTQSDYQTGHFSIRPNYTPFPQHPSSDWKPSINGYEVNNSIAIKTDKLDLAGKLIDAANKGGANSIDNIHFGLSNSRQYWGEAIDAAVANAIQDAKVVAAAAGIGLGRLISISLDNHDSASPRSSLFFAKTISAEAAPPIESGNVPVTASVTVIYEIDVKP